MNQEREPLIPAHPVEALEQVEAGPKSTTDHEGHVTRDVRDNVVPETATTGRKLGWGSAYILVLSRVIGSGIFAMPGTIVQNVGSPALALSLWVVGALIAYCGLAIDMEFGTMLPRSGGMKVYLEYTYRKPRFLATTLVAVHVVVLGFTASNCIVFAKYVLFALDTPASDLRVKLVAVGLMTAITLIHGVFYRTGLLIQNILGWLKIALILFMIFTGLFVVIFRANAVSVAEATTLGSSAGRPFDGFWQGSDWSYNTIATALFKIIYSYAGLDNVNNVLNEVKNPIKTLKTVPPLGLITACLLYLLINVSYLAVVPVAEVKESRELIAALFFERVFGNQFGGSFLPIAIALSAAGNVMVVTFSLSRINQEVARAGLLPFSSALSSSRPFDSPLGGLIVHYFPSVLVIILPPSRTVYAFIAEVEGYSGQFFALAVAIGLLLLRRRKPDLLRPFRAWTPIVWLRVLICVTLIVAPLFPPKARGAEEKSEIFYAAYALVGWAVLVVSFVYWYLWTRLIPMWRGHELEEEASILPDGTSITRLVSKPKI